MELRIGHGYDIHRLEKGRDLILGTVKIPYAYGLLGHSDADCVCHAMTDALLGALSLPNIGQLYSDHDPETLNISSQKILTEVYFGKIRPQGFTIMNMDSTIIAQEPRISSYLDSMRERLSSALKLQEHQINIKVTSHEHLDAIGKQRAIACHAVCLLVKTA